MLVTMVERVPLAWRTDTEKLEQMIHRAIEAHEHSGMERTAVFTSAVDIHLRGMWGGMVDLSMTTEFWRRDEMTGAKVLWAGNTQEWLKTGCICGNWCSDDVSLLDCNFCKSLDVYDPCPVVGFGCGIGCDCCTPEQQKAAGQ